LTPEGILQEYWDTTRFGALHPGESMFLPQSNSDAIALAIN
jgi:hypothetical protein